MRTVTTGLITILLSLVPVASPATADAPPTIDRQRALVISGPIYDGNIMVLAKPLLAMAADGTGKPIDLIISSPGGEVETGFGFLNVLAAAREGGGSEIRCFVPTVAASMAFQILLHCDERYALDNAALLWHGVRTFVGPGAVLTAQAARDLADTLEYIDEIITEDLQEILGKYITSDVLLDHMRKETLHVASALERLAPGFLRAYPYIPGLLEALSDAAIPNSRTEAVLEIDAGRVYYIYN